MEEPHTNKLPFKVNRDYFPTGSSLHSFLNPRYCFAQGNLKKTEDDRIVLDGRCRIVQFGHPLPSKHCAFVLDVNVSPSSSSSSENPKMTAMSLMFDDMGRVEDAKFGNGTMKKVDDPEDVRFGRWIMNIPNGTHASFGHLPTKPSWTCTRVLKGSFDFVGCERTLKETRWMTNSDYDRLMFVQGEKQYVSCVQASRALDEMFEMSPENVSKIQPFFETVFGKVARYGTHSEPRLGNDTANNNAGHESFVYLTPDGTIKELETRNGDPVDVKPMQPRLSVHNTSTGNKFKAKLQECVASLEVDMPALRWLSSHPLEFSGTYTVLANRAFGWVQDLHSKFLTLMAPGLSHDLFKKLATTPLLPNSAAPKTLMQCACTPSNRDPLCRNKICTHMSSVSKDPLFFVWPSFKFVPNADQSGLRDEKTLRTHQRREAVAAEKKAEEDRQRNEEEARQKRKEEEARKIKEAQARIVKNRQEARAAAAAATAAERAQESEAPTRSSRRSAQAALGTSEALVASKRARVSASSKRASPPNSASASKRASTTSSASASKRASTTSSASASKRSKHQGGTRRQRHRHHHHRRSIRR